MQKTIGILGGMGPEATLALYNYILKLTPVKNDQDHIKTIIYSNPKTPDRTAALINGGKDPSEELLIGAKSLKTLGADFMIVPCNTAHKFLPKIAKQAQIPLLDMIQETKQYILNSRSYKKVGLLATTGTIKTGLYEDYFLPEIDIMVPDDPNQALVMECIYGEKGIKAGYKSQNNKQILLNVSKSLIEKGAEAIVLGCTELPLVLERHTQITFFNPLKILAKSAVNKVINKRS